MRSPDLFYVPNRWRVFQAVDLLATGPECLLVDMRGYEWRNFRALGRAARRGVVVIVVKPESLDFWHEKALRLSREGVLLGVFSDCEDGRRWAVAKALVTRGQLLFEKNQRSGCTCCKPAPVAGDR